MEVIKKTTLVIGFYIFVELAYHAITNVFL